MMILKRILEKLGCEMGDCLVLSQDRVLQWWAFVNTVINILVSYKWVIS
jgi:hypothetical protein